MTLLGCWEISKSYGSHLVLDGVELTVEPDQVVGLIGPNGSGKSTLLKIVAGLLAPDSGSVSLMGVDVTSLTTDRRRRLGLTMKSQMPDFVPSLSVAENLYLAGRYDRSIRQWMGRRFSGEVADIDLGPLAGRLEVVAAELSHGEQQWLDMFRCFLRSPNLVLLDEPAAGMSHEERQLTEAFIRALKPMGGGVLIVDHDLDLIQRLCDRIVVLHHGRVVASGTTAEIQADPNVRSAYLGIR